MVIGGGKQGQGGREASSSPGKNRIETDVERDASMKLSPPKGRKSGTQDHTARQQHRHCGSKHGPAFVKDHRVRVTFCSSARERCAQKAGDKGRSLRKSTHEFNQVVPRLGGHSGCH